MLQYLKVESLSSSLSSDLKSLSSSSSSDPKSSSLSLSSRSQSLTKQHCYLYCSKLQCDSWTLNKHWIWVDFPVHYIGHCSAWGSHRNSVGASRVYAGFHNGGSSFHLLSSIFFPFPSPSPSLPLSPFMFPPFHLTDLPLIQLRGLGRAVIKLPSGSGDSLGAKCILVYFEVKNNTRPVRNTHLYSRKNTVTSETQT